MAVETNQQKLSTLFIGQRSALIRMLSRVVGCASLAEDLAQETYLKVAKALNTRPIEHLHPFLYQTAQYLAFDHLRSQRSKRRFEDPYADENLVVEVPTSAPGPDSHAQGQQQLQQFQQVLATLPKRQQQILILHKLHGLAQAEIAQRLQVSLSTVEKDLRNALTACIKATDMQTAHD
ncbi:MULTISPECIES: RNA polymerase sigma factor [Pseudomonas]|uniref:RNA polymerase sigma factor n=1 Tax=Pseudomonas sp. RC2C2 TaxID=2834408 RepID=UPI00029A8C63|nr:MULTISPECIES: RNA polymerase sigma factor [Pseudomonas]MDF9891803.1 RNA polymerase sigma-70 factor (ECF subfamily) [Pseudomonas vranovensis]MCP6693393.1 RNA polymerase sigma factor [Pseudomonas donghuensis]UVL25221.1 RNA polymerase sigma factor [Pseudomonas donghuensis]UVL30365.1 RNA polymerase sigma factor [Pseudomonas donghuensis]WKY29227.1 RNA polymerase sigma factor [Pseudomonas donghuensis]